MTDLNDFEEELKNIREEAEEKEDEPIYSKLNDRQKWVIGIISFSLFGFIGAVSNPEMSADGIFMIGAISITIVWLLITETGAAFRRTVENFDLDTDSTGAQQQQQQIGANSHSKNILVCQNCGWQNPTKNNYCHDCGNEIE